MTKAQIQKLLETIPDDEPLFLVRGSDRLAPGLVRYWAGAAAARGAKPSSVQAAHDCAGAMERWPDRKFPS